MPNPDEVVVRMKIKLDGDGAKAQVIQLTEDIQDDLERKGLVTDDARRQSRFPIATTRTTGGGVLAQTSETTGYLSEIAKGVNSIVGTTKSILGKVLSAVGYGFTGSGLVGMGVLLTPFVKLAGVILAVVGSFMILRGVVSVFSTIFTRMTLFGKRMLEELAPYGGRMRYAARRVSRQQTLLQRRRAVTWAPVGEAWADLKISTMKFSASISRIISALKIPEILGFMIRVLDKLRIVIYVVGGIIAALLAFKIALWAATLAAAAKAKVEGTAVGAKILTWLGVGAGAGVVAIFKGAIVAAIKAIGAAVVAVVGSTAAIVIGIVAAVAVAICGIYRLLKGDWGVLKKIPLLGRLFSSGDKKAKEWTSNDILLGRALLGEEEDISVAAGSLVSASRAAEVNTIVTFMKPELETEARIQMDVQIALQHRREVFDAVQQIREKLLESFDDSRRDMNLLSSLVNADIIKKAYV